MVDSHIKYMLHIYGGTYETTLRQLQILQNKAIRLVHSANYRAHTTPLRKVMGRLPIKDLYATSVIEFMYAKVMDYEKPNAKTRAWTQGKLQLPTARTETQRITPIYGFIKIFNSMPPEITNYIENPYVIRKRTIVKLLREHFNSAMTQLKLSVR